MTPSTLACDGQKVGRRYTCQWRQNARQIQYATFQLLLELILAKFDRPNGWLHLTEMRASGGQLGLGRQYIKRLRKDFNCFDLIENDEHGRYRLNISRHCIRLGDGLWKLPATEIDPTIFTRLKEVYDALQTSQMHRNGDALWFCLMVTGVSQFIAESSDILKTYEFTSANTRVDERRKGAMKTTTHSTASANGNTESRLAESPANCDASFQYLIGAWPETPVHIREAVFTLVDTAFVQSGLEQELSTRRDTSETTV